MIKSITLTDHPFTGVILLNQNPGHCLGVTIDQKLLLIDLTHGEIIKQLTLDPGEIQWEKTLQLHSSPGDHYIAITNRGGQHGAVYNTEDGTLMLKLDRGDYHVEQTAFPVAFFQQDNTDYLIHGVDWNKIELTELPSGKLLSERAVIDHKSDDERYLDYFYGSLHISPDNKFLLTSGWVWQPVSVLYFTDLQQWFTEPYQPELGYGESLAIWSYYWDRALCWVDDETVAYCYDPLEEGDLDEEDQPEGFEKGKQYIAFYQPKTGTISKKLEVTFPVDQYHEAHECALFFNNHHLYLTSPDGVRVINPEDGTIVQELKIDHLNQFHQQSGTLYSLKEGMLTLLKV